MKTALVTGGAARIGAQIAKTLHDNNFKIIIHCNESLEKAEILSEKLNSKRKNTVEVVSGNLNSIDSIKSIVDSIDSLDLLVNNASVFYPKSVEDSDIKVWDEVLNVNLRAPFFLSRGLSEKLSSTVFKILSADSDISGPIPSPVTNEMLYLSLIFYTTTILFFA